MLVGFIILDSESAELIYVHYNCKKDDKLPHLTIPIIHCDAENISDILPSNLTIKNIFISENYIPNNIVLMLICTYHIKYITNNNYIPIMPIIGIDSFKGFVYADLLFKREFFNKFLPDEQDKILKYRKNIVPRDHQK